MTEKEEIIEREMKKILEWSDRERKKLDEKYKSEMGLDIHNNEYKAIRKEQVRRMQELKRKYGKLSIWIVVFYSLKTKIGWKRSLC